MAFPLSARSGQRPAPSPSNPVLLATQSQWLFTDEELTRTPSQLDGMKMEAEYVSRCKGVNFITQVGIMLRLPQLTIATAAVYLQRFFMRYSMADLLPHRPGMHPYPVAATSLFLATKVEENVRRMREFVVACCRVAQKQPNLVVDEQSREYWKWRDTILHHEDLLLEAICFDLQLEQPYRILYDFLCFFAVNENKSLRNASWAFINDSMYTVLCLQFTARTIGAAALYAAARHCDVGIEDDDAGRPWWEQIDVDLSMMRRACTRMVEFYENNAIQRHSQYYPTTPISPDEGPEKTRIQRAGVSVESKVELEATKGTETTDISHAGDNEKATRKRSREPDANDAHGNGGLESHKKPRIPHAAIFAQSTRADANSRLRPSSPTGSAHGPDFDERKRSREPHEEEIRNRRETNEDRSPKRPRMTGSTTADSNEIKSSEPPSQSFTSRYSSHAQGVVTPKEASSRRSLSRDRSRDRNHMNGHVTHDNQLHTPPLPRPPSSGCRPSYPRQPYYPHRNSDDFHWDKDMKRDRDRERDNKPGGGDPVQQRIDEIVQKSLPPPQTHHSSSSYSHHPQHDHWPENRSSGRHWGRDRDRNRDRSYDRGRDRGRDWDRERDRDRDRDNRYHYHRHHHHSRSRERSRDWGTSLLPPPPLPHHFRHERERGRSATSVSSERGSDSRRDWSSNYDHDNDYERGCDRDRNYHKHQHQHNHHKEYPNQDRINKELPAVEFGGEERRLSQGSEEGEVA